MKSISPKQFAIFRIALGSYLAVHFAQLIPYGTELFSNQGLFANPRLNFTYGILPNPLEHWDSPASVTAALIILFLLAIVFAIGLFRRTAAMLLWFGWACLFNRNNLINNPSIPYIGLLLLLSTIVPPGDALDTKRAFPLWRFPAMVYWTAWILMAAGYSFSGWAKLHSPSWIDGSALFHVLDNPLARCGPVRDFLLALPPWSLRMLTWAALGSELLFLPLSCSQATRRFAWCALLGMNIGILFAVNFTDLTVGMFIVHLFTYDPDWFPVRRYQPNQLLAEATT
jgi:uncharacterized membrane protein YphA (DoxX/SURF4 family)